ncbi:glycosyltransferase [Sphingomonas sp. GCM10030256]|uniref:glycosyltransferase n=1 Tax=Sphingomonas sp. GCM10030256 TaxID=3273427 RepID=UPI00360D5F94
MKVLHLILTADPKFGGPIEAAQSFAREWIAAGVEHDLLTLDAPGSDYLPDFPGRVFCLGPRPGHGPLHRYRYSKQFRAWLRAHKTDYDAVLVSGLWRYLNRAARCELVGGDKPYFVFTHGMLDPWFRRTYPLKHIGKQVSWWLAEGPLLAGARNVLFTCEEERLQANQAFWPYRVEGQVVNYGASDVPNDAERQIAAFRAAVPRLGSRPHLLFLSRIHEKKGCDLLIDAFASIAAEYREMDLVIAGPDQVGLVSNLTEQARNLGIQHRVHFPGMLQGEAKYGAFRSAEAFTLTSHQENFGIVVAEALACGTPVLISDKVNIWREIVEDEAGYAEPDTREGSRRLLQRFLSMSADQKNEMRHKARQCFERRYRMEDAASRLLEFLKKRVHS